MEWVIKGVIIFFVISCFSSLQVNEALGDCELSWPEDPFHQAILLLESPISPYNSLIQDVLCQEYPQGIKHYLSIGAGYIIGGGAFLIDLDDYYGISAEGKVDGGEWVTVYGAGGFDFSVSLLPITLTYIVREDIDLYANDLTDPKAADPYFDPEYFWGISLVAGYDVQFVNVVGEGGGLSIEPGQLKFNVKVEFAKAWYTLGPLEVKKQVVETWFSDLAHLNGRIPGQTVCTLVGQNLISQIFNFDPDDLLFRFPTAIDGVPSPPPASPDFEPAGIFFDTIMPVQLGTTFNIDLRIKNRGLAQGTGELLVYLEDRNGIIEIVYDSKETSSITLSAVSETTLSFPLDTSALVPGEYVLKAEIYNVTPTEANANNNLLNWGFHITSNPSSSIDSILPNPAIQGVDTVVFTASGNDPDNHGTPPEIHSYCWTSDLGKADGDPELYNGTSASFSLPASDLRTGIHNIFLTIQDNEGDWSEPVTDVLTINQAIPSSGYDIEVDLYVSNANVTFSPGSSVTGEIWALNHGDYSQSGYMEICLETSLGVLLDSQTYEFSSLEPGSSTNHQSFSLNSSYEGEALVRAKVLVELDEDWSNNEKTIPVFFSTNLNPTDSFDGFEELLLSNGETKIIRSHTFHYEDAFFYVNGESFGLTGEYVTLPTVVFQYSGVVSGKVRFWLWWPDNLYTFSSQYLTIPWGGSAIFEVSRPGWPNETLYDMDFLFGLLPSGWSSSVSYQADKLVVQVGASHGSGTSAFTGWAHMHYKTGSVGAYSDAFQWMKFQAVFSPPETAIVSGPEGIISTDDITFVWSGSDDTTPTGQLQYAYRLEPLEAVFSSFSIDTEKTYNNIEDGEYTFFVKARDLGGKEDSTPASQTFTVATNRVPDLPVNQFPLTGQPGLSITPTLVASEFSDPDNGDTFAKSMFQIRSDTGTYNSPQWDSGELSPGTINVQTTGELAFNNTYWWRCRYQDNKGSWGPWSNETSFRTSIASDFDRNYKVDFSDFSVLSQHWLMQVGWREQSKLIAADSAASDYFGWSVSISGDYAIVGAPFDNDKGTNSGSVYIFTPNDVETNNWDQIAKLNASDGATDDYFGTSVSVNGNYAIIGARFDDDKGSKSGSTYIFAPNDVDPNNWDQVAKLTASDGTTNDDFGYSVSISGDYAIVGACLHDHNGNGSGSAYTFKRDGISWSEQAELTAVDAAVGARFGISVSISGDYAIVGADLDDDMGDFSGSVYIFKRDGTSWTKQAKLTASGGAVGDRFGTSVSVSGSCAIVGADGDDDNGSNSGSAYIFKRDGTSWSEQAKLTASDGAARDYFGTSVSVSGSYAIVGARDGGELGSKPGSAYIFKHDGTSWSERAKLTPSGGAVGDRFGTSVSVSGSCAIVGADRDDDNGEASGSAYIFKWIPPSVDLTGDSYINYEDLALFALDWLKNDAP